MALLNHATITTIDSFCAKVVKENFDKIDLDPGYRLADETEIDLLKNDILENCWKSIIWKIQNPLPIWQKNIPVEKSMTTF